jgi:hypothetical protein
MLTLFFAFFAAVSGAHAQSSTGPIATFAPQPMHEGNFELRTEFEYLQSGANYLPSGGNFSLPYGKFQTYTGMGQFSYDFTRHFRAFAGASGGQTSASLLDSVNSQFTGTTVTYTQTVTGFSDAWLGGQYWYRLGRGFTLIPQAEVVVPFFRVNPNPGNGTLYGEGVFEGKGGTWLSYRSGLWNPYGFVSYDYRDQGRSSLLSYDLGVRYGQRNDWWLEADFHGFGSVTSDTNTNTRYWRDNTYLAQADGYSQQFYAINPSRANIGATGGMDFEGFGVYVGVDFTAFGQESANYWSAIVGVTLSGSFTGDESKRHQDGFSAKPESYDSTLFRENAVPQEPVDPDQSVTAPRPRRVKNPSVDTMMKDAEQNLDSKTK